LERRSSTLSFKWLFFEVITGIESMVAIKVVESKVEGTQRDTKKSDGRRRNIRKTGQTRQTRRQQGVDSFTKLGIIGKD
jgi:hypothetical protein